MVQDETPEPRGPEQKFRDFLAQGRFMVQRARTTGRIVFYPRMAEPGTGDSNLEWVPCEGIGTVYSTTVVRRRPDRGGDHNVALIDLDDGFRMLSRVEMTAPDAVPIGLRVKARIAEIDGEPAVVFDPLDSARGHDDAR
jgi:uncharacterized OB-fold protein